jgi:hypothetical protein
VKSDTDNRTIIIFITKARASSGTVRPGTRRGQPDGGQPEMTEWQVSGVAEEGGGGIGRAPNRLG